MLVGRLSGPAGPRGKAEKQEQEGTDHIELCFRGGGGRDAQTGGAVSGGASAVVATA